MIHQLLHNRLGPPMACTICKGRGGGDRNTRESLSGDERCGHGFEPWCDPSQCFTFPSLVLFLPSLEVSLAASSVGGQCRSSRGLHCEDVRLKSEWIYELYIRELG